ncbi:hypothetical protein ONA91_40410 [Micromonospora sp. DR5-3]|uniref:hypothetical protein n=1 Tax=unclassified Micromonospora TaxID=2617518 RepID=UPI0011D5BE05|nr:MULTISPECIES: hypothetical protein [unclassified Micromonospora]MCW3820707.1 hypothetical protein [Micromonospora sp. DR5-3]TYC19847.1 hypothetical protein FXF52_34500 [Micromonospora sp. MP36]
MVTAINMDGTAIGFSADNGHREGEGLVLLGEVPWTDASGADHQGSRPTCLAADSYGQRVELGIIDLHGTGGWPTKAVVWVHRLS